MRDSVEVMVSRAGSGAAITLDARQRVLVDLPVGASGVVVGAPGTGKTSALVARVERLLDERLLTPDQLIVLTPTRQTATVLRDRLGAGLDLATPGPLARSTASFAFQLVRSAAVAAKVALPQLLTASDQDRIIADLLAGDEEDAATGAGRWPEGLGDHVRRSRAFRAELRALSAQCSELGIAPADLARLGAQHERPAWSSAASFFDEYRYTLARMRPSHRDPAELVREAAGLLATGDVETIGPAATLRVVLVDDAQELTRGGIALLAAARQRGLAVLAFGDPDIGSGAFRGAGPELFDELIGLLGDVHVLDIPHRASHSLTRLTRTVTASIGAGSRVEHRRAPGPPIDDDASVSTIIAASPFEEVDRIARTLREWHVMHRLPWESLAVIAHDTRQIAQLEVELAAREVPTRAASVPRPLGSEAVVRDLVGIVRIGMTPPLARDPDVLADALVTPYGGLDAVGLRRVRARLRVAELADGGSRSARDLLAEALAEPAQLALIDAPEARRAEALALTLGRVHAEAARGATVHELLWIVWERSGLERRWVRQAGGTGALAEEATRALDALVALFGAAKRAVERAPDEGPARFIREILDSEVPEDLLTAPERSGAVSLLTPAAALGTQFEAVVVAGVQEGIWPNTRLRGGLLDGWRLADAAMAWREGRDLPAPAVIDRRRSVLHEELRLFVRAVSRARSQLVVTATSDDDMGPSALFAYLPDPDDGADAAVEHPLTLRGLVSAHRRTLTTSADAADRTYAARQLALLADAGVSGARPQQWYGISPPSSDEPLHDLARGPVRVSPSRLEGFEKCGLDWAVRTLGGDTRSFSSGLGTILHAAMETAPDGDLAALQAVVDERWGELEFEAPWLERQERAWAGTLVERLHSYLRRFQDEGGEAIGSEARFRLGVELPESLDVEPRVWAVRDDETPPAGPAAVLSGSIDRVEVYPPDRGEAVPLSGASGPRVVVMDLKTGRSEARVSDEKVHHDAQLAAYQLAVTSGLVEGVHDHTNAGARLLVLSKTLKNTHYRIAHQSAMAPDDRTAFLLRIAADARGMASASFIANIDAHCTDDRFAVCRLHTVKAVSAS
ncbi:ATP-dependent DNA helicase [Microbacterium pumilum]|uniref:DNA 3'-5' helicase n=1 Tax=Microbacterium pumilum TaxID=344165 RepID=A0ABN2STX2_9MICO